jgi:hypothetical protein
MLNNTYESALTARDWSVLRRIAFVLTGVLLLVSVLARSALAVIHTAMLLFWMVAMYTAQLYFRRRSRTGRPWNHLLLLNHALGGVSYVAWAEVFPVFAGMFKLIGDRRPVPAMIMTDLSHFMKAWWWVLLPIGIAILGLTVDGLERWLGKTTTESGLRLLTVVQVFILAALGVGYLLARLN